MAEETELPRQGDRYEYPMAPMTPKGEEENEDPPRCTLEKEEEKEDPL